MEILDEIGLADCLFELPHAKVRTLSLASRFRTDHECQRAGAYRGRRRRAWGALHRVGVAKNGSEGPPDDRRRRPVFASSPPRRLRADKTGAAHGCALDSAAARYIFGR